MSRRRQAVLVAAIVFVLSLVAPAGAISGSEPVQTVATGSLSSPTDVVVTASGITYIADVSNHRVQMINADGIVSTVLGVTGSSGSGELELNKPSSVAVDTQGNLYIADRQNHRIQRLEPDGTVSTVLGVTGSPGGAANELRTPVGVAVDDNDNLYVADLYNHRVQKMTPDGVITTVSGTTGSAGGADNQFRSPTGVAVDAVGNVYVADVYNHRIQKIAPDGTASTLAGTTASPGAGDQFRSPSGVDVDSLGNVYVADRWNHRIQKIAPDGKITTVLGTTSESGFGPTQVKAPSGIFVDLNDNLYVVDTNNHRVQLLTADTEAPTISITSPAQSEILRPNTLTTVRFACSDTGGSEVNSCLATINGEPVQNGDRLNDGPGGLQTLEVRAVDGQGHRTTESLTFRLLPPDETLELRGQYSAGTGVSASVARLYMSVLARQPDQAGHTYWLGALQTGTSLEAAGQVFLNGPEYHRTYNDLPDDEFVENLYLNVLNRPAEPVGAYYWLMRLDTDLSREQVILWFSESTEFKTLTRTS